MPCQGQNMKMMFLFLMYGFSLVDEYCNMTVKKIVSRICHPNEVILPIFSITLQLFVNIEDFAFSFNQSPFHINV